MKIRYFKFIEIDKDVLKDFLNKHQRLSSYVDLSTPFNVRISRKPFAGLIHTIISQDQDSSTVKNQWLQLNDFAKKVTARKLSKVSEQNLISVVGKVKASLIKQITNDVMNKTLNMKELANGNEQLVIDKLSRYESLSMNSIHTFAIFCLFKQNVLAEHDPDFIKGLKIFLNKQNIESQDIDNIKIEYRDQLTLFSLCMWKINNERSK